MKKSSMYIRREAPSPKATDKLIEYGVMSSVRSSAVKVKLDALGLVENEDYNLQDILQVRKKPWKRNYKCIQARSAVASGDC